MSSRIVALLAAAGLLVGALYAVSTAGDRNDSAMLTIERGVAQSFLEMGGSAYVVSGIYQGTAEVEGLPSFAVVVELENPVYLGDDSPDNPTQTPAPKLSKGETITVRTEHFDADRVLEKGDRVLAIVAHHSAFEPPWVTVALGRGKGDDVTMIGANGTSLERELAAVASALNSDRETAFFTIAAEQLEAADMVRAGSPFADSMGPALTVVAASVDSMVAADSAEGLWEEADPAVRGLQRGVAPDSLLDSLPELNVTFSISDAFIEQYPGALIQIRNELGVTASVAADLGEASDILYGSPGAEFEVTVVTDWDQKSAQVIGVAESRKWSDAYALDVTVTIGEDGTPVATTRMLNEDEFALVIEQQTKNVAHDTAEDAVSTSE